MLIFFSFSDFDESLNFNKDVFLLNLDIIKRNCSVTSLAVHITFDSVRICLQLVAMSSNKSHRFHKLYLYQCNDRNDIL